MCYGSYSNSNLRSERYGYNNRSNLLEAASLSDRKTSFGKEFWDTQLTRQTIFLIFKVIMIIETGFIEIATMHFLGYLKVKNQKIILCSSRERS